MERAKKFYSAIYDYQMPDTMVGPVHMGFFLYEQQVGRVGGAIISLAAYAYISLTKFIREYKEELLADYGGFVTVPKSKPIKGGKVYSGVVLMMDTKKGNRFRGTFCFAETEHFDSQFVMRTKLNVLTRKSRWRKVWEIIFLALVGDPIKSHKPRRCCVFFTNNPTRVDVRF